MKNLKKILALALALAMVLSLGLISASAVGTSSIVISNAAADTTYNAYKIFDMTTDGDENFAYTIDTSNQFYEFVADNAGTYGLTLTQIGTSTRYNVSATTTDTQAAALAAALNAITSKSADGTATTANGATTATITDLAPGYYFVDSGLGALCALGTSDVQNILEKNDLPVIEKEADVDSQTIGGIVNYTITITVNKGADKAYEITDELDTGLEFNVDSFEIGGVAIDQNSTNYTFAEDTNGFTLTFTDTYVKSLTAGDTITLTYSANVTAEAAGAGALKNTALLKYGEYEIDDEEEVYTYQFELRKIDAETESLLDGAEFKLYDADDNEIPMVFEDDGEYYRPAVSGETAVSIAATDGEATIKGLALGTYYLEETVAPNGYTLLTERVEVVIEDDSTEITIENSAGVILPGTGGMGTVVFTIAGSTVIMLAAAALILIGKKRFSK